MPIAKQALRQTITGVLVGILAGIPASELTAATYLFVVLNAPMAVAFADGAAIAGTMVLSACAFGGVAGAVAALLDTHFRAVRLPALLFIAVATGASFGLWAAHGSPHVSSILAAICGAVGWTATGLIITVVRFSARYHASLS